MSAYNKFNTFVQYVCNKNFNLASDTCKVALSNTAPVATNTTFSTDITDLAAGNGYSAGGTAVASPVSTQSSGTETFSGNNVTFTASGGSIGPFRYVVLYDSTPAANNLIAWFDYGVAVTITNGNTFTVQWNGGASSGTIFTMT